MPLSGADFPAVFFKLCHGTTSKNPSTDKLSRAINYYCTAQVQQMRVFHAQLEKEIRAEKKRNRKMLEEVDICIILLQLVKK